MKTNLESPPLPKSRRALPAEKHYHRNHNPGFWVILLALAAGFGAYRLSMSSGEDFLSYRDGKPELAPWRKEKLEKELEEFDHAEQYVLKARIPGYYPCYNCYEKTEIYLNLGEVWRYGVTTKKEKGRYPEGLPHPGLFYFAEFSGRIDECLKMEKMKIYNYALLPENLTRERPLIRPPGNKLDR